MMFTTFDRDSSSPNYGSPAGVYNHSQNQDFCDLADSPAPFVPTVTAISSCPDLQWMVQSVVSSVAPSSRAHPYSPNTSTTSSSSSSSSSRAKMMKSSSRRGRAEQLAPEEDEKKRLRRERNKMAAAKCRNRRRELTDTLQAETDQLEDEKSVLQNDIAKLMKEKERLEFILAAHRPICKIPAELEAFPEPSVSPALSEAISEIQSVQSVQSTVSSEASRLTQTPSVATTTTSLFSSTPSIDLMSSTVKISDLDPSLEASLELLTKTQADTTRSVPDVDLSASLYAQDWEPLYTPANLDLEPLCTPVVTCTPTCTTYTSSFLFTYPEGDTFQNFQRDSSEHSSDSLNSPTLLTL